MAKTKITTTRTTTVDTTSNRFSKAGKLTGSTKKSGTITNVTSSILESKRGFRFNGSQTIGIFKTLLLVFLLIAVLRFIFSNGDNNIFTLRWFLDTLASPNLPYLDLTFSNVLTDLIPTFTEVWQGVDFLRIVVNSLVELLNFIVSIAFTVVGFVWNLLVGLYWIFYSIFGIGG